MYDLDKIVFFDLEVSQRKNKIVDIGCLRNDGRSMHGTSLSDFSIFVKRAEYLCGHNIFSHDLPFIANTLLENGVKGFGVLDTLYLSPLLFPKNPYHKLVKDDKLQTDELNNPLNDCKKAKDLFLDEINAFNKLDESLQQIFFDLLKDRGEFRDFFKFLRFSPNVSDVSQLIRGQFAEKICHDAPIELLVDRYSIELAYSLALLNALIETESSPSITPPWVFRNFPRVQNVISVLRSTPCRINCEYCRNRLDVSKGLETHFGFSSFRKFGDKPLQQMAAQAALRSESFLAVFPTGGGKSITFQLPAIMAGENERALTIVISPLQSLMKDQVDNLEEKLLSHAVTINGLLDPIERAKSIERVADGSASLLYISPESLRSKIIESLILNRKISRFVIDEAHCFSAWGQDFRVDYLYIGDFIKMIGEKKGLHETIPVSCFTATAKQKVIEDIKNYFKDKLSLNLNLYSANVSRTNLHYGVWEKKSDDEKYYAVRDLVEGDPSPAIVYVSRTKRAMELAERLTDEGFNARAFHGKMDVKEKTANQDAFKKGEIQVMVATSAFGMGVDKDNVKKVIHYDISDSLENYVQEAGRAGRSEKIEAECHVLFNEDDLNRHFILLKQTKLSIKEIQQTWSAIKSMTKARMCNSALEIARRAGWDDTINNIGTRVTSAIAALEDAGYVKRTQNMPRVFADSIQCKTAQEALDKIEASPRFDHAIKENASRVIKKLIAAKSRRYSNGEQAEARVDYISEHLGIPKSEVIKIVNLLREEKILGDSKDLTAYVKSGDRSDRLMSMVRGYLKLEVFLLEKLGKDIYVEVNLKELNEKAQAAEIANVSIARIRTILNFWTAKGWLKCHRSKYSKDHLRTEKLLSREILEEKLARRSDLAAFVINYLTAPKEALEQEQESETLLEFSVHELKRAFENSVDGLFKKEVSIDDVEDVLFYLSKIEALKIEGGFLVVYNALTIERLEKDNKIRYKQDDYKKLEQYYEGRIQQIHIVGEYAKLMIQDYQQALQFVSDYFQLNYQSFLNKYFKGSRQSEIKRALTPAKFEQLFATLSPTQLQIIKDDRSKNIVVAAGPGSGKTRVLVHKLASLILMEEVKHEQLLMLTFSRAAATEFKSRLISLIGNVAHYIEIKTFHSYCFDLLGRRGSLEASESVIENATQMILDGEVESSLITKSVLVIDEAQDMNKKEFKLVKALAARNEELKVIAVGDDDQNIYEFRGANSVYFEDFTKLEESKYYELLENYRSGKNLVEFTNQIATKIVRRMKHLPISPNRTDFGKIKITQYTHRNLITPVVQQVMSTELSGTSCLMTIKNGDAEKLLGVLTESRVPAKLIQSNDGFNLCNLEEVHCFLAEIDKNNKGTVIDDDLWEQSKKSLATKFNTSARYDTTTAILKHFETTNRKKYRSDLETFIRESKLEDFIALNSDTLVVSTIHKTKGKEFDNVFLMLEDFKLVSDEACRLLYVGLTRAKNNLYIHLNTSIFDGLCAEKVEFLTDTFAHQPPKVRAVNLTHRDVWLDYFIGVQESVEAILAGTTLKVDTEGCLDANDRRIVRFSKHFKEEVEKLSQSGYILKSAKVNFSLYWPKEGKEYKILLPEVVFCVGDD